VKNEITVQMKTGHLIKQLEAVRDGIDLIVSRLREIPDNFCPNCASGLNELNRELSGPEGNPTGRIIWRACPKCGEIISVVEPFIIPETERRDSDARA